MCIYRKRYARFEITHANFWIQVVDSETSYMYQNTWYTYASLSFGGQNVTVAAADPEFRRTSRIYKFENLKIQLWQSLIFLVLITNLHKSCFIKLTNSVNKPSLKVVLHSRPVCAFFSIITTHWWRVKYVSFR